MNKPKILIVEDESIIARDICQQLGELGYEAVADTSTGEDAIVLTGQLKPDLVLMDIRPRAGFMCALSNIGGEGIAR